MQIMIRIGVILIAVAVAVFAAVAANRRPPNVSPTNSGPPADYEYHGLEQALEDGYIVEFPIWAPAGRANPDNPDTWHPERWNIGTRIHDEPEFFHPRNPFADYEFTTMEQAIADGYYIPFEIWVPDWTLDNGLVVPGHWSWAIRRYDEPEYEYPPADHVIDLWADQ